jgi:hypothetical protein
MEEHQAAPTTGAETPPVTIPSAATMAQATAQATARSGGKKVTPASLMEQASALQSAETIKQLQRQVKALETQTRDTGVAFLATVTTLVTSAFGFVAALAWNDAIQAFFKQITPFSPNGTSWGLVISNFSYALFITVVVVFVIFQLTNLNKRLGGKSLIGEVKTEEGSSKKETGKDD